MMAEGLGRKAFWEEPREERLGAGPCGARPGAINNLVELEYGAHVGHRGNSGQAS